MRIRLLGPLAAEHDGRELRLGAPRQRAVLAMLALSPGRTVSTDALVDGIWGDDPPGQPLASLQVYVHGLRRALADAGAGKALLASRPPGYSLDISDADTDLGAFQAQWTRSRELSRAPDPRAALRELDAGLALWRGDGLGDLRELPFAEAHVVALDEARALALEDRIDLRLACGEHAEAVAEIEAMVAEHPTRERRWGQLMVALYRCNRQADALSAFARARDLLADELGIDPGDALRQIEVGILRHEPQLAAPTPPVDPSHTTPGGPAVTPSSGARPRPGGRLPEPTTTTWGRDELAGELAGLVSDPAVRLLSLVGPGGTGKTRLATVVASRATGFDGARYFVTAEDGWDATALLTSLLLALGGAEPPDPTASSAADAVAEVLGAAPALVVLDNLEVVSDASYGVETLVKATETLTVVVTTRLPLRLAFEAEVVVPPVALPDPDADVEAALAAPAVALFADRARLVNHRFAVDESNVADVVALCRLLDGVPLALELAAARMRLLTPAAALDRLGRDLSLLSPAGGGGASTAPQRTLAGTIDWSLAHLPAAARALATDLAVFEDGFGLEGVEAVAAGLEHPAEAIEELGTLIDSGLAHPKPTRVELRFQLLGPVRSHLRGHPGFEARRDAVRELHLAWMADRLPRWAADLDGPDGDVALGRFDDEHADLLALVDWALAVGRPNEAAALAGRAQSYWLASGRIREGLDVLRRFDGIPLPDDLRRSLLVGRARLAYHAEDFDAALTSCREALAMRSTPGSVEEAAAYCYLGAVQVAAGDSAEGVGPARRALELARERDEWDVQAVCLSVLAIAAAQAGDFDQERAYYEERLAVVRRRGDRARTADTLNTLAEIALDEPDLALARDFVTEALRLAGEHRPMERRDGLITAARISVLCRDFARAESELDEALGIAARTGQPHAAGQAARVVASLLVARGEARSAARLFARAHVLSPPDGEDGEPFEPDLRDALRTARDALGADEYDRLLALAAATGTDTASVVAAARASAGLG